MAAGLPSAVLVEIEFSAGVWTDVGSLVKGDSIEIRVGRDSAASGIQPGMLDVDLDNADGRFTPDNPTSTHYPNFVEGKRIRVRVTKSGTTYVRFVGRITSITPDYPNEPTQSVTHLAAVDILGDLARVTLPSVPEAIARLNPDGTCAFYPLTDANEHLGMVDILATSPRLKIRDANPGTGRIDARADDSLGDGASYVQLFDGKGLWTASALPDGLAPNPVVTATVKVTSSSYGEVLSASSGRRAGSDNYAAVRWTATGFILDTYVAGALTGSSTAIAADDGWYFITLDPTGGSVSVVGAAVNTSETSPGAAPTTVNHVAVGGDLDMSAGLMLILGSGGTSSYSHNDVTANTFDLAVSLTRFAAAVYATGLAATFSWSTTPAVPGAPLFAEGVNALDALVAITDSQSGYVYAEPSTSASQTVRLLANVDSRSTTVALTVDAEGDLVGGPTLTRDIDGRIASAVATSSAGSVTARDASVTNVGSAAADVATILADDNDLYGVASDRIARGRDQQTRLTSLTVDLATASNDLYASFYAVTPGERLRLSGLPTTYFGLSYIDGYVEGWTERPGVTGYPVVFDLSPADAPPEAIADTSRAPWGDGVCTVTSGTAVGTTSTGTIVATFTGTAALSTSAGDYPMDFDWNGERVTVTSAPAGGTSPRTLTLTARGVAPTVARVHAANEALDVWQGASVAL